MNFHSIDHILEFAIDKEKEAVTFYTDLSRKEAISSLKETFRELAQEEARHVKMLTTIAKNKTTIASYELKKVADLKISDYLVDKEYVEGMGLEDILTIAMKREEMAVKLYKELATKSSDQEAVKLFTLLAQEEAQHKLTFEKNYDDLLQKQGN
jgi:rubrerythrin